MNSPTISLLLPTYKRPQLAQRFFRSVVENVAKPDRVEIVLYVDEGDPESHRLECPGIKTTTIIGPQSTMGEYNSACLARSSGEIVVLVNDDLIIKTKDWDEKIAAVHRAAPDGIYLAYPNDLYKQRNLCTFPILSRRTCELLVDPYPKAFKGALIDINLYDIFMRLKNAGFDRLRYMDDLIFEHLHFLNHKAPIDETYRHRSRFEDDWVFIALAKARDTAARRLEQALRGQSVAPFVSSDEPEYRPTGAIGAITHLTRMTLLDPGASLTWRTSLWVRFVGRYMASRGWLGPLGNPATAKDQ